VDAEQQRLADADLASVDSPTCCAADATSGTAEVGELPQRATAACC
jgi:hypothetical protein